MGDRETTVNRESSDRREPGPVPSWPYDRLVCGIDGSDEAVVAALQASRIAPGVPVTLVHAVDVIEGVQSRRDYPAWIHARREAGAEFLDEARRLLQTRGNPAPAVTVEEGAVPDALDYAVGGTRRALLSIGSGDDTDRGLRVVGPPPTGARLSLRIIEAVPCSVLVARRPPQPDGFPRTITVGVDGSEPSMYAYTVAERIAATTEARLAVVIALGGKGADLRALQMAEPPIPVTAVTEEKPVKALLDAASGSDLIIVGNRGLHGIRALGSVSNRIVTDSRASVLVVRDPRPG